MKYYVVLFKKFNNYFNRIIKGYDTLAEYEADVGAGNFYHYASEVNYNPADNVSTELIMNDCPFDADYLIYYDDYENIVSRWFILETVKMRNGQYKHSLRRDVIYENHSELMTSPVYVQKGMLSDADPFIFNSEGMSFNQIKKDEILLKDSTKSAWAIIYLAKNATPSTVSVQVPAQDIVSISLSTIASDVGISEAALARLLNFEEATTPSYFTSKVEIRYGAQQGLLLQRQRLYFTGDFDYITAEGNTVLSWTKPLYEALVPNIIPLSLGPAIQTAKSSVLAQMSSWTNRDYLTDKHLEKLQKYQGKTILYNGGYYTLDIQNKGYKQDPVVGPAIYTSYTSLATVINNTSIAQASVKNDGELSIRTTSAECYLVLKNISYDSQVPQATLDISSTRNVIQDQAFDIVALNVDPVYLSSTGLASSYAKKMALAIAEELDANVYDVQLLPYCPMPEVLDAYGRIDSNLVTEHIDYDFIYSAGPFRGSKIIEDNNWTITDNIDGTISATYTWTGALPPLCTSTGNGYSATYPSLINSVNVVLSSHDLTITCNAASRDDLFAAKVILYQDFTLPGATGAVGIALYPKNASFSAVINESLSLKDSVKVESQCNKYRIVSPNYQGSFDFNVAKNGGSVPYFIAECTYKPYTPYIKVVPYFSPLGLYGINYGDNRGLICGGDFSLSRFTSAWESFQLNNKNYQNIFNREIQSLDLEQSIDMRNQIIGASVGTITGGAAGAASGAMASGSWIGAIVGGVVGTAGSAMGGAIDTDTLAVQQRNQKGIAIDKYNYQLGNIKALPYTLTKVGAFDINSKIWPFLEYYTCTDEEKEALENKILYESMTVMRIDLFGSYWGAFDGPRYFKGELIRNTEIAEDNHIFEAIYAELLKGVYI